MENTQQAEGTKEGLKEPEQKVVRGKVYKKSRSRSRSRCSEKVLRPKRGSVQDIAPDDLEIIDIAYPISLEDNETTQKKYKTIVEYRYEGLRYRKKLSFGNKKKDDFVDTHDPETKQRVMKDIKAYFSPLQANYYRVNLCNTSPSISEAYAELRKKLDLKL